jgi:hypothetical protein
VVVSLVHTSLLVVSHSTCPPLSSSPHAHSFVLGTTVINTHYVKVFDADHGETLDAAIRA